MNREHISSSTVLITRCSGTGTPRYVGFHLLSSAGPCVNAQNGMSSKSHVALYGNTKLLRSRCSECGDMALVLDLYTACCGAEVEAAATVKRMSEPYHKRKRPPLSERCEILQKQNYCCIYCERRFDSYVQYKGNLRKVKLEWDHYIPFSYNQNNATSNFVAACSVCNGAKSDKIFQTLEDAQEYIIPRLEAKGYGDP